MSKQPSEEVSPTMAEEERFAGEERSRRRVRQAHSDENLRNRNTARRQQKRTKSGEAIAEEWRQPGRVLPQVSSEELQDNTNDEGLMQRLSENLHDEVLDMKSERMTVRWQESGGPRDPTGSNASASSKKQAASSLPTPDTPATDDDDEENEAWEDVEMAVGAEHMQELERVFRLFMDCLDFPARAGTLRHAALHPTTTVPNGLVRVISESSGVLRGEEELRAEDAEDLVDLVEQQLEQFPQIAKETERKLRQQVFELDQAATAPEMLQQLYEDVLCLSMDFMGEVAQQKLVTFYYKQRKHKGRAIHVAALHWEGVQLLNRLSLLNVDVQKECTFCAFDAHGAAQALHLAAGCGNHDVIRALLSRKVNLNVKTKQQCREHYTALHEATFFQLYSTVELLLGSKASPNLQNLHGLTPLHIAAKNGNHQIAKMLLASGADVKSQNNNGETALVVAIEEGRFPNQKLHHLAERSIEDVLQVARLSPIAAADLMRDTSSNSKNRAVHHSWREALTKEHVATETWIDLLKLAPQAAEDLLDAVTTVPYVENKNHHPLPRQAFIRSRQIVRCHYTDEEKWSFNASHAESAPRWHWRLAPMQHRNDYLANSIISPQACLHDGKAVTATRSTASTRPETPTSTTFSTATSEAGSFLGSGKSCFSSVCRTLYEVLRSSCHGDAVLTPVRIKIVRLSGLLSIQVLHALATTPHMRVFRKVAVRAIVDHIWNEVVMGAYIAQVFYRVFELLLLALYVHKWDYSDDIWYREAAWSLLAVSALRDMFYEVCEMIGVMVALRKRSSSETTLDIVQSALGALLSNYISDIKNVFDFLSVFMLGALLFFGACSGTNSDSVLKVNENKATLALVVSCRWFQLLYTFRAFKFMGYQLVPIMQSFWPVSGMILITVFMFIGFWHAFLALSDNSGDGSVLYSTFVPTFRFLFLGDGDGIDEALNWLQPSGYAYSALGLIACTIVFSVWILNLFIALIGEAYDHAKELSKTTFQQERATICLQHLLRPAFQKLPLAKSWCGRLFFVCVAMVTLLVWLCLLRAVAHFVDGSLFGLLLLLLPTALLLSLVLLGDAMLMTHHWQDSLWSNNSTPKYLWICHRADFDEARYWPSELSTGQMYGTLTGLKHDSMVRSQRMHDEIATFRQKQDNFEMSISSRLLRLEQRMDAVFCKLDRALPASCMDGNCGQLSPSSFGGSPSPSRRFRAQAKSRTTSRVSSPIKGMTKDTLLDRTLSSTPSETGNPTSPVGGTPLGGEMETVQRPSLAPARTLLPADVALKGADPVAERASDPMGTEEPLQVPAAQSGGLAAPPAIAEAIQEGQGGMLSLMKSDPSHGAEEAVDDGLEGQAPSRGPSSPSTEIIVRLD